LLYITTRDNKDAFTAHHALTENRANDGGGYIPFQMPHFTQAELIMLMNKTFSEVIAEILNLFFTSRLTGWDVECCIGRNIFKISTIHHKITIAELWHTPQENYNYIVEKLYSKICPDNASGVSEWFCIAVRIAILFGLFVEMQKQDCISTSEPFDICIAVDDFDALMAAFYARGIGLPVDKIICAELENSCLWDLIQRGTFNTWTGNDKICAGIERLLQATLGFNAVGSFRKKCEQKQAFLLDEAQLCIIRDAFFCSVVGESRISNIVSSVYRSNNYMIDPQTALCHGGLQDFRAKTGNSRTTLLLANKKTLS
jgi:threonine synthase